jgi:hypothetical protein
MAKSIFTIAPPQDPNSLEGYTGPVGMVGNGLFGQRNGADSKGNVGLGAGGPFRDRGDNSPQNPGLILKTISQNPERYSKVGTQWIISANGESPNKGVTPLSFTPTPLPFSLKPYLNGDGIIIKAGEHYLISKNTLNMIVSSNNPHYDTKLNGIIVWRGKQSKIGQTIPIIEIDVTRLPTLASERDIRNKTAGVNNVEYIFEGNLIDGVPTNLIEQINYTLNQDIDRPMDKFSIWELQLGDDKGVYSIEVLKIETAQEDGSLDKTKLQTFLSETNKRLQQLRKDFNMIKDVFYNGAPPDNLGSVTISLQAQTNPPEDIVPVVFKYSTIVDYVETPQQAAASNVVSSSLTDSTPTPAPATVILPTIEKWRLKKDRDGKKNGMGIYPTVNIKNFNFAKNNKADKRTGIIREGETFTGYKFKTFDNTRSVWAIQSTPDATPTGYAYQGPGDSVDKA